MTEQELIESEELAKQLYAKVAESYVTYFPLEDKYMCHVWGKPLSGMRSKRIDAIREALTQA